MMGVYCRAYLSWFWLIILCAGLLVQAADPIPSDCPLDFSELDFTSTVAVCANSSYGSCCDHSKALAAVAMSQYTRNTSNLQLPSDLVQPCTLFLDATFKNNNIELPVATWCALNASVFVDTPCQEIRDVNWIHNSSYFLPVQVTCGPPASPLQALAESASCRNCLDSQAKFLGNMTYNGSTSESWRSCADTIFLSVASLGNSDYAMDQANCFFQLEAPNEMLLPQSRCPVMLQPAQITSIAESCTNITNGNDYNCCGSALMELRISLTEVPPMSTTFSISEKEGAACLQDLDSALLTKDMHTTFQTCNVTADDIFRTSTHGCYGVSTVDKIHKVLHKQRVDFQFVQDCCTDALTFCARCRQAVLDATYVVASIGGSEVKADVLQCCSDLVFLALVSNSTYTKASEIGSCLYTTPWPDVPVPSATPPTRPPASLSPVPSAQPVNDKGDLRVLIRLIVVLIICIVLTSLALLFLIPLIIIVFGKVFEAPCSSEKMPLTGCKLKKMKRLNRRKDCASLFRHFKFVEIQGATDNFSSIIGQGGFGTVYKARFQDGLVAAVKRMNKGTSQGEKEFCKEMELLGRLHHRHLVTLCGYCADRCHERLLVYEYCENGSLKEHLYVKPGALTWRRRLQIALDVAIGLEYLHSYCEPPLCHRDIKSSNILLSENFTAKIADFGLAHAGNNGDARFEPVTTEGHGTPGYMDPEYARTQSLTEKSDIYSFGVLLLELVTARRAINDNISLLDWAKEYMDNVESKSTLFVDSDLERHEYSLDELKSLVSIIKQCTQTVGKLRPTMQQIVRLLYDIRPTLCSSSRTSHSSNHKFIPLGSVGNDPNCS